ncbi:MAG: amidase [Burkholderiaceae bacterium]
MTLRRPNVDQLREIAAALHMHPTDTELAEYLALMEANFLAYDRVDQLPDFLPAVKYPRTPGRRPPASENLMNAWYVKTDIPGAATGPLAGRRVVVKDNIALAGVQMMNGASTLEGYVPEVDATVVTRILDAGGTIAGKAHCEYFCLSGGSHTNATGPVHNPWRMGYIAGGSSSGCGALVGAGEIELAIGGDQGGSVRIPAAFSGCYGMKGTFGLVPYTGAMPIEATIDHLGPMTSTVADNALLLEVIAGEDGLDPRQYAPQTARYTQALNRGVEGLRIGVLREGFGLPNSEAAVDAKVRAAADRLARAGALVSEVSVAMHLDGPAIWTPITLEGLQAQLMNGNGMGFNWRGMYLTSLIDKHAGWRARADELSPSLKISMFVGSWALRNHRGRFHAKAQNLSRQLRLAYDAALENFDLLLMPTVPMTAQPIPKPGATISEVITRAFEMVGNTAPFNATGHPAMSVPCGLVDGLPVGMMLVGRYWDEVTLYRAAAAFERAGDWKTM